MSRRRNRNRKPARRPPFLEPKPRILIVCEGKVTEPGYLQGFANACENPRVTLEIAPETGVPLTVVKAARDWKKGAEEEAKKRSDDNILFDAVWAVFDVDDHPHIHDAIQLARDNDIDLAVSNPAFELWLLLHFQNQPGMKGRAEVRTLLKKHIMGYDKRIRFAEFKNGYQDAVNRAKPLGSCDLTGCEPGPNPSTGVYVLTESIRND